MSAPVDTVASTMGLAEAANVMRGHRYHHLIVKEGGRVVGVLCDSDIVRRSTSRATDVRVGDVMSRSVAAIDQNETVRRAANLMRGRNVGCLAVMDDGRLCGVVTISDLLTLLGKGVDRRESGPRASLHYRTRHGKQRSRPRW